MLHDYIKGRIEKSNVRGYIKLNHAVRHVAYDETTQKFLVTVKDLKADVLETSAFDYVVNATGHFSTPNVPYFEGVEAFPGRVLHAHDFRSADEFAGKNVLLIGASYSSEDIGIQCMKYGAKSVTFSYRTRPMGFDWPRLLRGAAAGEGGGQGRPLQGRHAQGGGRHRALHGLSPPLPLPR